MRRFILISEGFESKDYKASVMAESPKSAIEILRKKGHSLSGQILLEEVAVGDKEVKDLPWYHGKGSRP